MNYLCPFSVHPFSALARSLTWNDYCWFRAWAMFVLNNVPAATANAHAPYGSTLVPSPTTCWAFSRVLYVPSGRKKKNRRLRWENKESIYVTISTEDCVTYLRRQLMLQSSVTLLGRVFWSQREFDTSWPSIARTHLGRRFLCPEIGRQKWLKGSSKKWCDC